MLFTVVCIEIEFVAIEVTAIERLISTLPDRTAGTAFVMEMLNEVKPVTAAVTITCAALLLLALAIAMVLVDEVLDEVELVTEAVTITVVALLLLALALVMVLVDEVELLAIA